jgi:hypothetical protein
VNVEDEPTLKEAQDFVGGRVEGINSRMIIDPQ